MELTTAAYFLFLAVVVALVAAAPQGWRLPLLLIASAVFYARAAPAYLPLLAGLSVLNYGAAAGLTRWKREGGRAALYYGILAVDIGVLAGFKYLPEAHWLAARVIAPLGISYFTFQMVAAVTDAYRSDLKVVSGLGRFVLFGMFFPQISSGPIPRAGRLLPQLAPPPRVTWIDIEAGLRLIAYGLFKKYVVANRLSDYTDLIFAGKTLPPTVSYSVLPTALGCGFATLILYSDFSGYVDIALGSARLLGIRLDPNFDRPFTSVSITEFWRRWHMTLSFWLRDYLYVPLLIRFRDLGRAATVGALIFTFAVCGVWHAARWHYLLFGVVQGVAMSAELLTKKLRNRLFPPARERLRMRAGWVYAMTVFVLSEVLFRAADLPQAGRVYAGLLRWRWPHGAAEMFAFRGPFAFAQNLLAVGAWLVIAALMRRPRRISAPAFAALTAVLTLVLGRLGGAQFIYAAF